MRLAVRVLRFFLIVSLMVGQPAMAVHGPHPAVQTDAPEAGQHLHHHYDQQPSGAQVSVSDCADAHAHSGSCNACCAAFAVYEPELASLISSAESEPVQPAMRQPDLAPAIEPPRS